MSCASYKNYHKPLLIIAAIIIAILSPFPYAGSWNDGSRLASVEALVDYHTWNIDRSIFVVTPGSTARKEALAWPPTDYNLVRHGTMDKLFINGHYYTDKSPVPSAVMAGAYKALQRATGLTAAENPPLYCYVMALLFSGGAYVISVCCIDAMGEMIGLSYVARLLFTWSFALCTVALPYAREVNNHIMLLAVFSAIMFLAVAYAQPGGNKAWRMMLIGSLAGIGYTIDLGVGPVLVLGVICFTILQTRSLKTLALMLAMAFPWFLMHHLLNYRIGGTFKPANAVAAYFLYPDSPFNAQNLTGGWAHANPWHFLVYSIGMMFGKKGFIGHSIPLYLCIPAIAFLLRDKTRRSPLVYMSLALIVGTWLIYGATSNNYSGLCCSIRWFVPLLAPFYYLLAVFLKERPEYSADLLLLSAWGLVMGALMWIKGPWIQHMVPGFWFFQAGALVSWIGWRWRLERERNRQLTERPGGSRR